MTSAPFLRMSGITKRFPGILALDGVSLDVERGEVHALLGENGAGKSTLMGVLAGVHRPDAGEILIEARPVSFDSPRDALRHGISMIYQELSAVPEMTVAENILLGREPVRGFARIVDRNAMRTETRRLCDEIGTALDPDARMSSLAVAEMQVVEIVKALSHDSSIVIMDEPTSALSDREAERLFATIRQLAARRKAIIYISHKLDEIARIADRVTVLRDGRLVATRPQAELSPRAMISLMVGRDLKEFFPRESVTPGEVLLSVRNLTRPGVVSDIGFDARAGEIVGLAGLMGAGRTELVETIFGLAPASSGTIAVRGREVHVRSPGDAIRNGIAMLSEDRKLTELNLKGTVRENMTLANLREYCRFGQIVAAARERAAVDGQIAALRIKTPSGDSPVVTLSGGNQQKVALSRRLLCNPDVLILDEPTRGIDVGAKAEIYGMMNELTRQGKAIVMVSSELPEVMGMSDRILVMHGGKIAGEFARKDFNQEKIMACATGHIHIEKGRLQ